MDRMLYVAMSGAKETLLAQANTSNNLANATTSGFLADFNQLRSDAGVRRRLPDAGLRHG